MRACGVISSIFALMLTGTVTIFFGILVSVIDTSTVTLAGVCVVAILLTSLIIGFESFRARIDDGYNPWWMRDQRKPMIEGLDNLFAYNH